MLISTAYSMDISGQDSQGTGQSLAKMLLGGKEQLDLAESWCYPTTSSRRRSQVPRTRREQLKARNESRTPHHDVWNHMCFLLRLRRANTFYHVQHGRSPVRLAIDLARRQWSGNDKDLDLPARKAANQSKVVLQRRQVVGYARRTAVTFYIRSVLIVNTLLK